MSNNYDKLIIDGNNFLFRAFFVKRPDKFIGDINVSPIHQFLSMLKSSANRFSPKEIILTWDKKLNSTKKNFRKDLVSYKSQRVETDKIVQLLKTIEHVQKFIDAMGIKTIYPVNMEADDVIRYLAITSNVKTMIVSSDRDLLQLVDENTSLFIPSKDVIVNPDNFENVANVNKEIFLLYKSIMGDVSDNIQGLDKFGPVRAKNLAEKIFKNGVMDLENAELTPEQLTIIKTNLSVVDLQHTETVCPDEYEFYREQEQSATNVFEEMTLRGLFKQYEFPMFTRNFMEWNNLFNRNRTDSDLLSHIMM